MIPNANPPDPRILELGNPTDQQRLDLETWIDEGSASRAAKKLGKNKSNIIFSRRMVEKKAAKAGWTPAADNSKFVAEGYHIKGVSSFTDGQGNVIRQWVKTDQAKEEDYHSMRETVAALCEGIKPFNKIKPPAKSLEDKLTLYTVTDYHVGMYSFAPETGGDWDVEIAENTLLTKFAEMIELSPDSEQAIFCQMGDFLHWDGILPVTYTSKNILDADTRYPLLVQVAVNCCVKIVEMLLNKHNNVHVIMAEGNHDIIGSVWLQHIMKLVFANNERVTVDDSMMPFYGFRWGQTYLGWHHGHLVRINKLASKFYSENKFRKEMALCDYIYLHTGHTHQEEKIEEAGVIIERHPTLAQRDAHGSRGFDLTKRGALSITYDKNMGEISRVTVRP